MSLAPSMSHSSLDLEAAKPIIKLTGVSKWYGTRDNPVHALSETDLDIAARPRCCA
jgi:hypothetical protein